VLLSLDFLYTPVADVDAAVEHYTTALGAELEWRIRAMGTTVAALRPATGGPLVLLTDHLEGEAPILVYRVANYEAAVAALRAAAVEELRELEIPHGPCARFDGPAGRIAVYELTRPGVAESFTGRVDP
jgi:hypothetical protein